MSRSDRKFCRNFFRDTSCPHASSCTPARERRTRERRGRPAALDRRCDALSVRRSSRQSRRTLQRGQRRRRLCRVSTIFRLPS